MSVAYKTPSGFEKHKIRGLYKELNAIKVNIQVHKYTVLAASKAGRIKSLLERDFTFLWAIAYSPLVNQAQNTSNRLLPHQCTDLLSPTLSDNFFCQILMAKLIVSLLKMAFCLTPGKD